MKTKLINYFFEDDEKDLISDYSYLLKVTAICVIIGIIAIIL